MFYAPQKIIDDLLRGAADDAIYGPIIRDLHRHGYTINFKTFGGAGMYKPQMVFTPHNDFHGFKPERLTFELSTRYGRAVMAHTFLHELYHFYQDSFGMFFIPLLRPNTPAIMPDLKSFTAMILYLEAMAATESIRAAWRLKNADQAIAWRGAQGSPEWRKLLKRYASNINKYNETYAAKHLLRAWYGSRYRRNIYTRRAQKLHHEINETARTKTNHPPQCININLNQIRTQMPPILCPSYMRDMDLNTPLFNAPPIAITADADAGAHAPNFVHGSSTYLWRKTFGDT